MPWEDSIDGRVRHALLARHLFPLERMYRIAPVLMMTEKAMEVRRDPAYLRAVLPEFRAAAAIDSTSADVLGRLLALELDLGLKDDAEETFQRFVRAARRGPKVKVQ